MNRIPLKAILFALVGLVAVGALVTKSPTPTATGSANAHSGACNGSGVTLVIDFGDQNKPTQIFCVDKFLGTSWQLFKATGVLVEGTAEYPESFVCRIQGVPSSNAEDCLGTPDFASGTWVYYVASTQNPLNDWTRSGAGAAMRKPNCGDYEGWRFVRGFAEASNPPRFKAAPFRCE